MPPLGAYGIALPTDVFPAHRLNPVAVGADHWTTELHALGHPPVQEQSPQAFEDHAIDGASSIDDASAYAELTGFNVSVDRASRSMVIESHDEADPERLVHPCLAIPGAAAAHWEKRIALHAGAVIVDGQAWGILADRAHGKSTTMAALSVAGFPIVTDDLLVVDDHAEAHAGPRCIDLRASSAAMFPQAVELAPQAHASDGRSRLRLATDPVQPTAPVAGFIRLEWSDDRVGLFSVSPADRLSVLGHSMSLSARIPNPLLALDLASRPMYALERPNDLSSLDATLELIASLGARTAG